MKKIRFFVLLVFSVLLGMVFVGARTVLAQTLVLTPSSGDAPSASGTLSGSGWCESLEFDVKGNAVSGSASSDAQGNLNGQFSVSGAGGSMVTLNVIAYCPRGVQMSAEAKFTFNAPTPSVRPSEPSPEPAPEAGLSSPPPNAPAPSVRPSEPSPEPAPEAGLSSPPPYEKVLPGPEEPIPIQQPPQVLIPVLPPPPPKSPALPPSVTEGALPKIGNTILKLSTLFDVKPQPEFGAWVEEWVAQGPLKGKSQLFELNTNLPADDALWQVSILPFPPPGEEKDYSSPVGLIASGPVGCVNCTFLINLETLLPDPKAAPKKSLQPKSRYQSLFGIIGGTITSTRNNLVKAGKGFWNLITGLLKKEDKGAGLLLAEKPIKIEVKKNNPKDFLLVPAGKQLVPLKTTYYFRAIPKIKGNIAGPSSNVAKLHWDPASPAEIKWNKEAFDKLFKCNVPKPPPDCFPPPVPKPYKAEILSYTPFIYPPQDHEGCFIVAKTVTYKEVSENMKKLGLEFPYQKEFENHTFAYEGSSYCPPPQPKKPKLNWYEKWFAYIKTAVNSYAFIWDTVKSTIIGVIGDIICPSAVKSECKGALAAGLDAAMVAVGLPPSLPNFDSLLKEGGAYFAGLAAKQLGISDEPFKKALKLASGDAQKELIKLGIPPEIASKLVEEAKISFDKTVEKAKNEFSQHALEEMAVAFGTAKAYPKKYVPKGVPVKPDPEGELQYPKLVIKITRSAEVETGGYPCLEHPGGPYYSHIHVRSIVKNTTPSLDPAFPQYSEEDRLFKPLQLPLPKLEPGQSVTFPVVFEPLWNWGFPGAKYTSYKEAEKVWLHLFDGGAGGLATIEVSGYCLNGETITTAASKGSYKK